MQSPGHWLWKRTLINSGLCTSPLSSFNVLCGALSQYICVSPVFCNRKCRLPLRSFPCSHSVPEMPVPSFAAIPLTAYGPMAAAAAAAAVVRGTGNSPFLPSTGPAGALPRGWGGGWDGVAFLGSSLRSSAACCRFHPQSHRRLSGHHQSRADGGALRSRQPGLRGQQLHQRCQPSPEHRLWTQPRGECSLCAGRDMGGGLCLHVVREVSSSGQSLSPQSVFWW